MEGRGKGRPRIYDYDKEGDELVAWAETDDAMTLHGFTGPKPYCTQDFRDFAARSQHFALCLRKAKNLIAARREKKACNNELPSFVYNRTAHCYDNLIVEGDQDVKELDLQREMRLKEFEAKLKAAGDENVTADIKESFAALMQAFSDSQKQHQAERKSSRTSKSKLVKS